MKHIHTYIIITSVVLLLAGFTLFQFFKPIPKSEITFGARDSVGNFQAASKVTINHKFEGWGSITTESLNADLEALSANNKMPMFTIEPWDKNGQKETLLEDISFGVYDSYIETICRGIENNNVSKVLLRWGHEVDLHGRSRYSWAQNKPEQYKQAFQHWVTTCKSLTDKITYMYSPAGVEGLEQFYPGDKYVDVIGLSVFGYPDYEQNQYGKLLNFNDVFNNRYERVAVYKKPIFIAEFGIAGTDQYKKDWLLYAKKEIFETTKFPLLTGIIYFNDIDPNPWVPGINPPDFRIDSTWLIS